MARKALFVGLFPPPVDGQRLASQSVYERFSAAASLERVDLDRMPALGRQISKLFSGIAACFSILRGRAKGYSVLYLAPHSGGFLLLSCLIALAGRCCGYRLAAHYHSYWNIGRRAPLMAAFIAICGPNAMHVVLGPPMERDLRRNYPSARNAISVSNCGFIAPYPPTDRCFGGRPPRLGHLSNLSREKGIAAVLQCLRALQARGVPATLWVGGPTEDEATRQLIEGARSEFGESFKYLGRLDRGEVRAFYRDIDIFLFPTTHRHEAEPLVLIDALASGVPVLATDRGCIGHLLSSSGGRVFPVDDFVAGAAEQIALWTEHPDRLAETSWGARARFLELREDSHVHFEWLVKTIVRERSAATPPSKLDMTTRPPGPAEAREVASICASDNAHAVAPIDLAWNRNSNQGVAPVTRQRSAKRCRMLATALRHRAISLGKRAAKGAIGPVFDQLRRFGSLPLASGKVSAAEVLAGAHPNVDRADFRHSFSVREEVADDGIEAPHRPIDTFHFLLDTRDPRYSFRNNVVIGPGNAVIYEDSIPLEEMSVRLRLLERPRRISGTVGYLSNTDPANYYHCLCLMLPLIGIYRDRLAVDPDYYYVGRPINPFHLETLARLDIRPERVLSHAVAADRLVADMPDRKRRAGAVDRAMLGFSRRLYFEKPSTAPVRRLFLGRGPGSRRRLANEDQFIEHAARYGFENIGMDGRSVAEQARLFAEAAFIIAPHGAALTNILFATPDACVLELLFARASSVAIEAPVLTAFREISAFVGCRYDCIFGEPAPGQRHVSQSDADFAISFDLFRDKLDAMLLGR
jgi:glycosyltransferase involved in cell wall biosynthesis